MKVSNAFRIMPKKIPDRRGCFYEAFRHEAISRIIGHPLRVRQANYSVSQCNTLRGIHGTRLPPGQAKLVTCVRGAALDIVVDLRVGSPTFGMFDVTHQDADSGVAVYLSDGLGHAFLALSDDTCMSYLCSTEYMPGTMIEINALDSALGLPWNLAESPVMSDKDAAAPTLSEAAAAGLLPTYEDCLALYARLGAAG
ncbi:NDP-hexose 3,5-(Or5-) epimerase [Nocardiopsis mwathae]|uniref:NDP-hexose 3,5-(Or5-) epimerase n=1 Tax=Nocardiopsis mwathae TaxID=1472723 RepID=A0A7W9YLA8_9ACTN|nr:dTDP-4-dehydrorhamnose 3,5-epimerase [Nocardiopsis mwathae]MBB6174263.1 NDP-hexose 3,5-(Or5-) epimerase [Nocardiopsis mwathae]